MRNSMKALLLAMIATLGTVAGAQVQPIPEQQLNNGFLGEQNVRLSDQGPPPVDSYAARAVTALDRKDYTRALGILRPYRRSHDVAYHFLAGRAYEGLGRLLRSTTRAERSHPQAQDLHRRATGTGTDRSAAR